MASVVEVAVIEVAVVEVRRARERRWRRWERGRPNELGQMDTVGGFLLADGTKAKALTGIDDHSRFCVSVFLLPRESARRVCVGLALAMRTHGVPEEVLTDNGKVFTGRCAPSSTPPGCRGMSARFRPRLSVCPQHSAPNISVARN